MKRSTFQSLVLGGVAALGLLVGTGGTALAQPICPGPGGSVGIPSWDGTMTWIHPSAFNPGGSLNPFPGQFIPPPPLGAGGNLWLRPDGGVSGVTRSPNGDRNYFTPNPRSRTQSYRRPSYTPYRRPSYTPGRSYVPRPPIYRSSGRRY